jgi:hypothetical protein
VIHNIRLDGNERDRYSVSGAVTIEDAGRPITEAARLLLESGATPSDELHVSCSDFNVIDMPLSRIAAERPKPPTLHRQTLSALDR